MSINGELISEKEVETYLGETLKLCDDQNIPANFFEITTGCAFRYFSESGTDVVVIETGLGGREDSTNVISRPALSIITSIGLEHTAILGNTVELIGAHKAGIIKKDCPALVGPNVPHETMRRCAKEQGAEAYYTCDDILGPNVTDGEEQFIRGTKYVDYDLENSRTARAALILLHTKKKISSLSEEKIAAALKERPPCRFQEVYDGNNLVILDIAHNPPAMQTLVAKLEATYPKKNKRFVVGFSADKDIAEIGNLLLSVAPGPGNLHLVEAPNLRAAKIEKILESQPKLADCNFTLEDRSIAAQVNIAKQLAATHGEILVVCGSVFLMAEARQSIGIQEPVDSDKITAVAGVGLLQKKDKK